MTRLDEEDDMTTAATTHGLRYLANCSMLFAELPLLQRPAAAADAGFTPSSSGGPGRTSRSPPTVTSTPS